MGDKETVILVHGTWSGATPERSHWYEPSVAAEAERAFTRRLDEQLAANGSTARCWAHCASDAGRIFSWTGSNQWTDRAHAAGQLADYVSNLQNDGWKCHVVAHSHGGNVLVDALPRIAESTGCFRGINGSVVTLGTPFIDSMRPIITRRDRRRRRHRIVAIVCYALVFALLALNLYVNVDQYGFWDQSSLLIGGTTGLLALAGLVLLARRWRKGPSVSFSTALNKRASDRPFVLAISSPMDEAWQLLHHIRSIANPFAPGTGLLIYLRQQRAKTSRRIAEVDRILGASNFIDQSLPLKFIALLTYATLVILTGLLFNSAISEYRAWQPEHEQRRFLSEYAKSHGFEAKLFDELRRSADSFSDVYARVKEGFKPAAAAEWARTRTDAAAVRKWKEVDRQRMWEGVSGLATASAAVLALWFISFAALSLLLGSNFYSAMGSPARYVRRQLRAVAAVPASIGTYIAKVRGWPLIQEMAFGLENYPFELPRAEFAPAGLGAQHVRLELLPETVLDRILSARSNWFHRNFGEITQLLSKMALSAADISFLFQLIERDSSLVHGAYYTDDECVARIAEWIAGQDRSAAAVDGPTTT